MPKRLSKQPMPRDANQLAHKIVSMTTGEPAAPKKTPKKKVSRSEISRVMAEMGRKGGKKGGKRRLETMTPEQRREVALKAAQARWAKENVGD